MPVDVAELEPIRRLLEVAQSDTGQARRVANFLLAWWNAPDCGGFDLTELWAVDAAVAADMLATAAFITRHHEYPSEFGLGEDFRALVEQWRPQFRRPAP